MESPTGDNSPQPSRLSHPSIEHHEHQSVESFEIEQTPLPPADGGKEAWLVLAGCTVIQLPVWGTQAD
jgi:hypothetical protein